MFFSLVLVVDPGAIHLEVRNRTLFVVLVLDVDIELHALKFRAVNDSVDVTCTRDVVGVALVEGVVGQNQLVHELDKLFRARELSVGELGLHAVVLATKVDRVAEVVRVTRRTRHIILQLTDLGLEEHDRLLLHLVRPRRGVLCMLLHHLHVRQLGSSLRHHLLAPLLRLNSDLVADRHLEGVSYSGLCCCPTCPT